MNQTSKPPLQRLLFYLILNILVSACTTLAILWLWDRAQGVPAPTQPASALQTLLPQASPSVAPGEQPTPLPGEVIRVENVFGVGQAADEMVVLQRLGDGELSLEGWQLRDEQDNAYTFPALILYPEGKVQVHSGAGQDSVLDLYWNRDAPVWSVGEKVTLVDGQGETRATYQIP